MGMCKLFALFLTLLFLAPGHVYGFAPDDKFLDEYIKGPGGPQEKSAAKHYMEGHLLVKFKSDVSEDTKKNLHKKHQSEKLKEFSSLNIHHVKHKKGLSMEEAINQYKADPSVEYAEPNYIVESTRIPNEPQFSSLWGLYNTGYAGGINGADISAPEAWDITTGSQDVVVAVIDTGVEYAHPDLAANMWMNNGEISNNGVDDDGSGYVDDVYGINTITGSGNPLDDYGHGTHVAGIIGAMGNNGIGVVGVNWNVKIMICKFLGSNGSGAIADAIECLEYVRKMKARGVNIIATNNSWGGGGYSQALYDAINAQRDILFSAAAGNSNSDNDKYNFYPANYNLPNVIAVAATDKEDQKASFSNYGRRTVHVGAPGDLIYSTISTQNVWKNTGGYGTLSGTSMATPHVTGLATLIKSQDPGKDWRDIKNLILSGGDSLAPLDEITVTGKRINAYGSLKCDNKNVFSALSYPSTISVGVPVAISALSINCAASVGPVTATTAAGDTIILYDDGIAPDLAAGDGIFTGTWIPARTGERIDFYSSLGSDTIFVPTFSMNFEILNCNLNESYDHTLKIKGGLPPYNWSVFSGSLPPGLSLNALTGRIDGSALLPGVFTFTVRVIDSLAQVINKKFSIRVGDVPSLNQRRVTYDSINNDIAEAIAVDYDGNFYVTGYSNSPNDNSPYVNHVLTVKYDSSGNVLWHKLNVGGDGDWASDIATDASGNTYVVGSTDVKDTNGYWSANWTVVKRDPFGNVIWAKTDFDGYGCALGVAVDKNGYVYVSGSSHCTSWGDYLTVKYDPYGNVIWTKTYGDAAHNYVAHGGIAIDGDGNIVVAGYSYDNKFNFRHSIVKYDQSGNIVWTDTSDAGYWFQVGHGTAADKSGNTYTIRQSLNDPDFYSLIMKYDPLGSLIWAIPYYGYNAKGIIADDFGNAYVTGAGYIFNELTQRYSQIYLTIKYDETGNVVWTETSETSDYGGSPYGIALDGKGSIYVTGIAANGLQWNFLTIKYTELQLALAFDNVGTGSGTVNISLGTSCTADCAQYYKNNANVTLTAVPSGNSFFIGWGGPCSGTGDCVIVMDGDKQVTAAFSDYSAVSDGSCGNSNGMTFTAIPTTYLCNTGIASVVTGSGPWNWTCGGVNGGTAANCTAGIQTYTITPTVGSGGTMSPASRIVNHGSTGTFTLTTDSGYIASVSGTCGGSISGNVYTTGVITANCSETITFKGNGTCGSVNGQSLTVAPVIDLCGIGTASPVAGSGPWAWSCAGVNGGTTASCSANIKTYTITPSVSSGGTISPASRTVNHGSTGTFTLTPNSGYIASVGGTCGGSISGNVYTTGVITANCAETITFKGNGACGSSNGQTLTTTPTLNLCSKGTASAVDGSGPWAWSCAGVNGGTTASCSANIKTYTITPSVSSGGTMSPASRTVNHGSTGTFTLTPNSGYIASVGGTCGGSISGNVYTTGVITANCSEIIIFKGNGACGSSNGQIVTASPAELCSVGTVSGFTGSGPWIWSCAGVNGGTTASCSANIKTYTITPSVSSGGTISPASRTVKHGTAVTFALAPTSGYAASLSGTCGGSITNNVYTTGMITDACSESITFICNGTCGVSNGQTLTTTPTLNLCSKGTASAVDGSGPWAWSCAGVNGGTTASCSANIKTYTITPSVSSGGTISPASGTVNHGSTGTFTLTPDSGYIASVGGTCGGSISGNVYTTGVITANCSEIIIFKGNGACGSSNGQILTASPAELCSAGTASSVNGSGPWAWTCSGVNGGTTASCSANSQTYTITPSVSSGGTISPASRTVTHGSTANFVINNNYGYTASLSGNCGGSISGYIYTTGVITDNCTENVIFTGNGACGSSNGQILTTAPAVNLCGLGSASAVNGSGPWTWSCAGVNGGTTANCSVNIQTYTVTPAVSSGGTISPASRIVSHGNTASFTVSPDMGYTASISGACGGSIVDNVYTTRAITGSCNETVTFISNGACGSSNGQILTATPAELCSVGTASSVTGSGPWTWSCTGVNGGTTASCSANIQTYTVTPAVSSGGTISPASRTVTHGSTASFAVYNNYGYTASVSGNCGGTISGYIYTTGVITDNCTENVIFIGNGVCRNLSGQILTAAPAELCSVGTASSVSGSGPWAWTCSGVNGGTTASCSANIQTYTITPSVSSGGTISPVSRIVSHGNTASFTVSPNMGYTASISGACGGSIVDNVYTTGAITGSCNETVTFISNGACGSSNGQILTATPAELCSAGTASSVNGSGPWNWTCAGVNGGTTASCSADIQRYTITPQVSSGGTISPISWTINHGSTASFTVNPDMGYTASLRGDCGGSITAKTYTTGTITSNCTETITFMGNGTCGSADGQALTSAPATNLCGRGTASEVTGDGPWTWTCSGVNGGTTADCSAGIQAQAITSTVTITPIVSSGGTINCTSPVPSGSASTCTIAPDPGWRISNVLVNGEVDFVTRTDTAPDYTYTYTFEEVTEDSTIEVSFLPTSTPSISVAPVAAIYDFRKVKVNSSSQAKVFVIRNTGTADLMVNSFDISGVDSSMFSLPSVGGKGYCGLTPTIKAGKSCKIKVLFTPSSEGTKIATLSISSNDLTRQNLSVMLNGTGQYILAVKNSNKPGGIVRSTPSGINCGSDCNEFYAGGQVALEAIQKNGYKFTGWSGDCTGTGQCTITMDSPKNVTANFSKVHTIKGTVKRNIVVAELR